MSAHCLCNATAAQPAHPIDVSVPQRPSIYRSGGQMLLRYEVHLANANADSFKLLDIEISDGKRGTVLERFAENQLALLVQPLDQNRAGSSRQPLEIVSGEPAVAYIDIVIPKGRVPHSLGHKLTFKSSGDASARIVRAAPVMVEKKPPLVLGPPLRGGPWVAVHHALWQRGHRRMFYTEDGKARLPGRFAIDWVGVTQAGKVTTGKPDNPKDALGYGAAVIAVANATVFSVRDGMAEADSIDANGRHSANDAAGNHVVLHLGQGRYAFYEHLKPGSIAVRPGQRVRRGETIGALGFTGDSTGPHLHFHVADGPRPLGAEGLPFVIDSFKQHGRYPDISLLGKEAWSADERQMEGERPAENAVVEFSIRR